MKLIERSVILNQILLFFSTSLDEWTQLLRQPAIGAKVPSQVGRFVLFIQSYVGLEQRTLSTLDLRTRAAKLLLVFFGIQWIFKKSKIAS